MPAGRPTDYTQELADRICEGIYAISVDGVIGYVGQAKNFRKRFLQHNSLQQNRGKTKKQIWLSDAILNKRTIEFMVLEETSNLDEREIFWIKFYRDKGLAQFNMADGGKMMGHCSRAKAKRPWGTKFSPIGWRIKVIKQSIRSFKNLDRKDLVERHTENLEKLELVIRRTGADVMNMRLFAKYGR